jgi:Domain of unknown function (DUF1707)
MASQPSLRIGDAEREAVAAELREHYAHGRLSHDEFRQRLDAVFGAKTQRDLQRITGDLPHVRPDNVPLPSAGIRQPSGHLATARPGSGGYSRGGGGGRHYFAVLSTLMAALAAWFLVYDVILVGLRWPLGGRIGLLLAVFAVIRGLLRRIFGLRRAAARGKRR